MKIIAFLCIGFSIVLQSCSSDGTQIKGVAIEEHDSLIGTGFTTEDLEDLTEYIDKNLETTGMMILHDGKVIYNYGDIKEISYIASCRKSVLSILYGKYVENGKIRLDQDIGSLGIDEKEGLLPIEKSATVDHLINSRSGVFYTPSNGGYDVKNIRDRGSVQPGEYFVYNNWDFNAAGYILEQQSGNNIYKDLELQLAIPLGFEDWDIKKQKKRQKKKRSRYPAYHMYLSTRDMAKIGQLMLNEGSWNGEQLISKEWISKITSPVTPVEVVNERYRRDSTSAFQFSYGYMWWIVHGFKNHSVFEGAYTASGFGGQYITVIPKRKMVIAHKTKLSRFVRWGIKEGGVSEYSYWKLIYKIATGKKELSTLLENELSIEDIIDNLKVGDSENSQYDISESSINNLGYHLMNNKDYDGAVKVFRLNTELYPNGFNTWDSYGEGLLKLAVKEEAIKAYNKSIELNPENSNAIEMLKEII